LAAFPIRPIFVEQPRKGRQPLDERLRALSNLSRQLVQWRGRLDDRVIADFFEAGYSKAQPTSCG